MYSDKPTLDMTPDGRFRTPQKPPIALRVAVASLIVAVVAGGLAVAALAFWLAFLLLPVVLVAGVIGYVALRFQLRRGSFSRTRDVTYPPDPFRP